MHNKAYFHWPSLVFFCFIGLLIGLSIPSSPPLWLSFVFSPGDAAGVTLKGFSFYVLFFLIMNYFLVALFGLALAFPFFKNSPPLPRLVILAASFFVGYTCLVGLIRILSLFCSYEQIYWPILLSQLLIIGLTVKRNKILSHLKINFAALLKKLLISHNLLFLGIAFIFIFSVLMLQIRQSSLIWNGHGPSQYAYLLDLWREQKILHFPVIIKHYDELIFHYFLTIPFKAQFNPILPWWITLALIKGSMLAFLFSAFRKLGVSSVFAFLFSLFMFLGTLSLNPSKYYLLFDSHNPLYFTAHSGRIVGIGLTILLTIDLLGHAPKKNALPLSLFLLSGLGLATTSLSNSIWLLLIYFYAFVSFIYYQTTSPESQETG